ncbi:MAG: CHAT domain-containing protein, partial [Nannocystaceae bacterium]
MLATPLVIVIELARARRAEDPFAFRFEAQDYVVRGEGGGFSRIHLDWDQGWLDDLAALGRPEPAPALLQRLGERLRGVLEGAGWEAKAAAIDGVLRAGGRVVVTIRSAAAELYTLPWELLTLGPSGQHLAELDGVLLRYEWPESRTRPEVRSPRSVDGRILVAWSAAGGAVPAREHVEAIRGACAAGGRGFDPERDVVAHASAARLEAALEEASERGPAIDALHVLCHAHGGPSGGLLLDADDGGGAQTVDPGSLRRLLGRFAGMIRLVVFAACESADPGAGPGVGSLGSLTQVVHRAGVAAVIGARAPLAVDASITFTRAFYRGLAAELRSLEEALLRARGELAQAPGSAAWAALQLYSRAADGEDSRPLIVRPYRGLLAFEPQHRRLLFGRDRECAEIREDLRRLADGGRAQLLFVAGASGTGKSSVVLGGFVPALLREREPSWSWERLRPGDAPLAALAAAAGRVTAACVDPAPEVIAAALRGWRAANPERALLLVVDQLEELFTQGAAAEERARFGRLLWTLASDRRWPVAVLCTIRVDFVGRCGEIAVDDDDRRLDRVAYDERHRIFIARGDRRLLREVIERPAAAVGLSFETGLVERILDDVAGESGALPLLGHALDLLWEHRSGRVLTLAVYREIGEIGGALSRHADTILDGLREAERVQARRLLVRLVSATGTLDARARLPLRRLRPAGASAAIFDAALGRLTAGRLLVLRDGEEADAADAGQGAREGDAASSTGATVEVAHEALLRVWSRLQAWIDEDQQRIRDLARIDAWVVDFEERGTLLDDPRIAFASDYAERSPDDFEARARALLDASLAASAAERAREATRRAELERSLRRARRSLGGAVAVASVALVLAVFAADAIEEVDREGLRRADDPLLALVEQLPPAATELRLSVLAAVAEPRGRADWIAAVDATLSGLPEQRVVADLGDAPIRQLELRADDERLLILADGDVRTVALDGESALLRPSSTRLRVQATAAANDDRERVDLVLDSGELVRWDYSVDAREVLRAGLRGDMLAFHGPTQRAFLRDGAAIRVLELRRADADGDMIATFAAAVRSFAFVDGGGGYVAV